jgi:hypothetical protein
MVTLTIILLLIFVPAARRILSQIFFGILGALGIITFVAGDSRTRRRGL